MRYAFFPGCALSATGRPYAMSFQEVARALAVDMPELEDWNCCGATCFQTLDPVSAVSLAGRNLALTEERGVQDLVTPCASCFSALQKANHSFAHDERLRQRAEAALAEGGLRYGGTVQVRHLLETLLSDVGLDAIRERVTRPLSGLRVACYYGCLLTRPPAVTGVQHHEYPVTMESLMTALGAEPLDWSCKTQCCGASSVVARPDLVGKLCGKIARNAREVGADLIAVACPLCQTNLDMHQGSHGGGHDGGKPLPVVYFTELMGVAFGLSPASLGLAKHLRDPRPLLERHGLLEAVAGSAS